MNTQITRHENILKHKYKHSLYDQSKAVREKNGFRLNNAPAPETSSRTNFRGAQKNEYRDIKSPSNISFGGLSSMSQKIVKSPKFHKILEYAHNHNSIFTAGSILLACGILRPTTIMMSTNVEMENRQISACKSIASGLISFAAMYIVSKPIEHALKRIENNPTKYLKQKTIDTLQAGAEKLKAGGPYHMANRTLKMLSDFVTSPMKGSLTIMLIPPLLNLIFKKNKADKNKNKIEITPAVAHSQNEIPTSNAVEKYANQKHYVFFKQKYKNTKTQNENISFKGGNPNIITKAYGKSMDKLAEMFGKFLNQESTQKTAVKLKKSKAPVETIMMQLGGTVVSAFYVINTITNKKIEEYRKKPLMYNAIISWAIATTGAYTIDKLTDKRWAKFCSKYEQINAKLGTRKLVKHSSGLKIMKSALIAGSMYRWITPWMATILADKVWKQKKENTQSLKK